MTIVLALFGALAVCLFGMKMMSESLQRVAGARLRDLLGRITSNRFKGVLTGMVVTSVIQSSTATTVMVVSFVSASLMTLTQAIGVIMGANIGTTLTGWIIATFGFKFKMAAVALPAAGVGLLLGYLRSQKAKEWGDALLGLGLLFLGIGLLKESIPPLEDPAQLDFLKSLAQHGFLSILLFVFVGCALTVIFHSSAATMALTLTMAAMGWISFEIAVAVVLGENIGTTATANLAAIGSSTEAKRAARVHLLFNVIGVIWSLALMNLYLLPIVDWLVPGDRHVDLLALHNDPKALAAASGVITLKLAAVHTVFNVTNTLLMLPFVKQLEKIVTRWVPSRGAGKSRLQYLTPMGIEAPELLLIQAGKEMQHMTEVVRSMFGDAMRILTNAGDKMGPLVQATIEKEDEVDDLEREISEILTRSTTSGTPPQTARKIAEMMENTHRLERIGDHCSVLVRIARRNLETGSRFVDADLEKLKGLGQLVDEALANLGSYVSGGVGAAAVSEEIEQRVDQTRRHLRADHIERMKITTEGVQANLAFLDAITHLEEVADRVVGIIRRSEQTRREAGERAFGEAPMAQPGTAA
ncbi:Na/Pi cotransporter family protein [Vulgatibacter incomptus]|uniref:Sodium-dependent phosphate transporter n=1 Tax=Vulgatibacter incomptus TaxID=1391653 RepID=A0A0K1PCT5_9BACT|nr:Na/Pi cotransporter family protein [Vulgatibacter incomptus]AKU91335.1 Sodium-dependent phosphate transporter [Vulgatibacter incomptus]